MLFKKTKHKALEEINFRLKMNAENNYRDATLSDLKELEELFTELKASNKTNDKQNEYYENLIKNYKEEFRGFTHKEQRAGW